MNSKHTRRSVSLPETQYFRGGGSAFVASANYSETQSYLRMHKRPSVQDTAALEELVGELPPTEK
ncbi:hypothetical protein CH262_05765 [Rhodococcus sp. 05-2255-1e]|jgi:hypothetical protein|uniref:Unannotated protein n=1 Tax=freshwater metagenome TaxID=449393 RepID=A0A6J7ITY9_9ZZZZ|nr:hypothetical protein VF34_02192 [Rhodococcus sp. PML026]OZD52157.1 hypothetical protein CH266_09680 [Rhodococcus sp. 06-1474-1B]OZE27501.1 hypothetical protein CH262_05765 [Rhodococcus sp. 05-2255-1e]